MEQLPLLASGSKATTTAPLYLTLDNTTSPSTSPPPSAVAPSPASEPSRHSSHERGTDTIKAKIMSHHLYPALLRAFIECQKIGAPPEVVGRLSALAGELELHSDDQSQEPSDPELDKFMETYCDVLVRYKQELIRPIQEADEFFRTMEAQMDSFLIVAV